MFDFNELCELYRQQRMDDARIMLYNNINVLMTHSWFVISENELSDKLWDMMLLIDWRIDHALNLWYQNKEIYTFVKGKIRFTLENDRKRGNKVEFNDDIMRVIEQWPSTQELDFKWEIEYEYILNYITDMEEPYRTVLLLHLIVDEWYNLQEISKEIWRTLYETTEIYKEGIRQLRMFLTAKYTANEETTTSES